MMGRALLSALLLASLGGCAALPGADNEGYLNVETLGPLTAEVGESSGLALNGDRIWTLNDSGNGPWLYRLDAQGRVEKRVRLTGASNIDWESMASDDDRLYVADCGNNSGRRQWLQLYSASWRQLEKADDDGSVVADRVEFSFADPTPVGGPQAHDNDCEAITRVGPEIWLLTKGWASLNSRLYRFKPERDRQKLTAVENWSVEGLVTGLDYSARRSELVVLGYTLGRLSSDTFIWLVPVSAGEPEWDRARRYMLWPSGQWEAVVWQGDDLLLTRENSLLGEARLGRVRLD